MIIGGKVQDGDLGEYLSILKWDLMIFYEAWSSCTQTKAAMVSARTSSRNSPLVTP